MAKVGYNFGSNRKVKSQNSGRIRRFIIFLVLGGLAGGALFIFKPTQTENTQDEKLNIDTSATELDTTLQTADIAKTMDIPKAKDNTSAVPKVPKREIAASPSVTSKVVAMPASLKEKFSAAKKAYQRGDVVKARELCLSLLHNKVLSLGSLQWDKVAEVLGAANLKILHSDVPMPNKKLTYRVQANDALVKLARKFDTTVENLQLGNNMQLNNFNIQLGQNLRVYKGNWHILVNKDTKKLYLYDGNDLFKMYRVGIGKQNRTPVGTFVINSKIKKPSWYSNSGKVIPFGDKENILGTRWLALKADGKTDKTLRGYGIHGTWEPEKRVGAEKSNGCITMSNIDVEELFSIVPYQTNVKIINSFN